jgi:ABC-type branched-subunit amino acid transport system ATPase component
MLTIDNINVYYGHAQVLHKVSMEIRKGEMVFVVGRNGAGKTTLLKTICGLLTPGEGTIHYQEKPIQGLGAEAIAKKGVQYVAQDKKVFQSLTVRENLEMAAYASGKPIEAVLEQAVKLYPLFETMMQRKAGGLSGGQREILLIARALAGSPELMLIDEPTEGLASIVIDDILEMLRELKGTVSGLIVEQNLSVVSRLADRVYVMKEGYIINEITDPAEISDFAAMGQYL